MGYFGARAVRIAWFGLVCPALMLNYFGQGALVLRDAAAIKNLFLPAGAGFTCCLRWWCWPPPPPSSRRRQPFRCVFHHPAGVAVGYLPRIDVRHTSDRNVGRSTSAV